MCVPTLPIYLPSKPRRVARGLFPPTVVLSDGDWEFGFRRLHVDSVIEARFAVYAWTTLNYMTLYIGRAKDLVDRQANHERREEAIRRGAVWLLIHEPGPNAEIPYDEVERRLIGALRPVMNDKFNPLARRDPVASVQQNALAGYSEGVRTVVNALAEGEETMTKRRPLGLMRGTNALAEAEVARPAHRMGYGLGLNGK